MLLQQLTYENNDKIYFLQEPKKSTLAVSLLQNQLKELKTSASTVTGMQVYRKQENEVKRFASTVTPHAPTQR